MDILSLVYLFIVPCKAWKINYRKIVKFLYKMNNYYNYAVDI